MCVHVHVPPSEGKNMRQLRSISVSLLVRSLVAKSAIGNYVPGGHKLGIGRRTISIERNWPPLQEPLRSRTDNIFLRKSRSFFGRHTDLGLYRINVLPYPN